MRATAARTAETSDTGGRSISVRVVAAMVAMALAAVTSAAIAPPRPVAATPQPDTVDLSKLNMIPERTWGVSGLASNQTQTPTIDNLVWDFVQSGNRMFVGGAFLNVQESGDATPVVQSFVAAFDVDTGDWIADWTPQLDRAVYSLDVLANGAVLVGGEFETVNGQPRKALVALDPLTGAIDQSFSGRVDRPWSELRAMVRDIKVDGDEVYIAGNFSHLEGPGTSRVRAYKAGRFDLQGVIDSQWLPQVTGSGVWGLDTDPGRNEVHLSGYFSAVNGEPDTGHFHTVDGTTGASVPGKIELPRNYPQSQREIFDVVYGDDLVFTIGEQHVVQVLDADDQQMIGYHHTGSVNDGFVWQGGFAGGGYQGGEKIGDVVFAGCHCTYSVRNGNVNLYSSFTGRRTPHRLVMAFDAATGELIEEFMPDIHSPRDGTWTIGSDTNGCLYVGGDFHVGGVDSGTPRWLGGFAKLCGDGPRVDGLLIDSGSSWRYEDGGVDLGTAWRAPSFDDGGWAEGPAEFGFGDGDEATVLAAGQVTYYARKRFDVSGPAPASLELRLKADDGAVVYLNGVEVLRDNLPEGPIGAATPAVDWRFGADEDFVDHTVSAAPLVQGENVLSVEVHNVWSGNNDLSFDVRLGPSDDVVEPPPVRLIERGASWRHSDSSAGAAPGSWPVDVVGPAEAPAQFGFGEGDETTVLASGQEAYYFANTFDVADAEAVSGLNLCLLADDGAVAYLNGTEVARLNMPAGPVGWNTRPLNWIGTADEVYVDRTIGAEALVDGANVMTVEVHNFWPGNNDLSFDLCLETAP